MGLSIAEKILSAHLAEGTLERGSEIALRMDQTLTQDATGTMAYLAFEAMGLKSVRTELSVAYVDHNTLQNGFENADDHRFLQSAAAKYGLYFSKPGSGICHQVHLERFGIPGKTLIGSDSHTPTAGGLGMFACGAGGMDVAVCMGGAPYHIRMPHLFKVNLIGKLNDFVTAKDVALELLRRITVKGGVGYIIEWGGEGVRTLSVPERATITNMGAETGCTTSIFPSDEVTRAFLEAQGRGTAFMPLDADPDAVYDKELTLDLSALTPRIACPDSPDKVVPVKEIEGREVSQVCIGSCTNSSLQDMKKVAALLRGKTVAPGVSLSLSPGSAQVLRMLADDGDLGVLLASGARVLECACGPCIGMGFSPASGGVSLRTFNRNFRGRSGTADAKLYLVSPETAVAAALTGKITDPQTFFASGSCTVRMPDVFTIQDSGILPPKPETEREELPLIKGPNIRSFPEQKPLPEIFKGTALLKTGDNITTDHIMPAGAKILPYRSNIPKLAEFSFSGVDPDFAARAKKRGGGFLICGSNYGQGSSREHAALVPLYLGIRAVLAKSFARIHRANLINCGILPLVFKDPADYDRLQRDDSLSLEGIANGITSGSFTLHVEGQETPLALEGIFSSREQDILRAGGLLAYTAKSAAGDTPEEQIERATESFRTLLREQYLRARALKEEKNKKTEKKTSLTIGIVEGDGIGPVIVREAERVLQKILKEEIASGSVRLKKIDGLTLANRLRCGASVPPAALERIKSCDLLLKGPTTTPKGGTMESANVVLRRELDLFANVRPVSIPEKGIDWTFFRENTEGEYVLGSRGISIDADPVRLSMDFKVTTEAGTERIARAAFAYAAAHGKNKVAIVTKANILKKTDGDFSRICHEIAEEYPGIDAEDRYVDIMAANLVNEAVCRDFQVFLLPNLYGDILTDEAAQLMGGVGTAGSANIGENYALFEAIHGSAPRMVEEGLSAYANPLSIFRALAMLLHHARFIEKAETFSSVLDKAAEKALSRMTGTRDGWTCRQFADYVLQLLK